MLLTLGSVAGGAKADASTFRGCTATPHEICDDFDDAPLGSRWTSLTMANGGALALVDAAVSPPHAVRASASATANSAAGLVRRVGRPIARIRCEFDFQLEKGNTIQMLALYFAEGPVYSHYGLNLAAASDSSIFLEDVTLVDGGHPGANSPVPAMALGGWIHVRTTLSTNPGSFTLELDQTQVLQVPVPPPPDLDSVVIGEDFSPVGGFSALFDNVFCDLE